MNTDTTATVASSSTDQVIGQAIIGLATWTILGAVSTYLVGLSTLLAMIISLAISLLAALRGTDERIGTRTRSFFGSFVKSAK
jgi:hypothetical protein